MAVATFVQEGEAIDYTPTADMAAGDVVDCGTFVGCAIDPIPANTLGALTVQGVFDFVKLSGQAIAFGVTVYWDNTNKWVTATGPADATVGKCIRAALAGDATVRVLLTPGAA
jgi:predicted RecA/RadA family phage recombinase